MGRKPGLDREVRQRPIALHATHVLGFVVLQYVAHVASMVANGSRNPVAIDPLTLVTDIVPPIAGTILATWTAGSRRAWFVIASATSYAVALAMQAMWVLKGAPAHLGLGVLTAGDWLFYALFWAVPAWGAVAVASYVYTGEVGRTGQRRGQDGNP